ncbi:archease [Nitrospirota bacterium]
MGYEMIDAGSDAGIVATSSSLEGVFREMALGMYSMAADHEMIETSRVERVEVQSHSLDGLLVAWLNELVYLLDTRGFLASKVEITSLDPEGFKLIAVLGGESLDTQRHGHGLLIKAATYHGLRIGKDDGRWSAQVMLDI